jgi:hypothetical protein
VAALLAAIKSAAAVVLVALEHLQRSLLLPALHTP